VRRIVGALFAVLLAMSLVIIPATPVFAGLGDDCSFDRPLKWENNQNSWNLYLKNWGRTPLTAMSRLAGLCANPKICSTGHGITFPKGNECLGTCACCNDQAGASACCADSASCASVAGSCEATAIQEPTGCNANAIYDDAHCCCVWGVSLAFANKSWGACDSTISRLHNQHPNHFGTSAGGKANHGGDWGITGCQHSECVATTWCLQDNLCSK